MLSRYRYIKRAIDIVGALVGLILFAVPALVIAGAIKLDSKGPVLFCQRRMGRHSVPFVCYKFRSMRMEAPKECAANDLENRDVMVTRVGNFLRRTSLDEVILTETWINEERAKRGVYALQPGITGLAQICGRNQVSDNDKLYFDAYYLEHYGFWLDVKILLGTVLYVLLQRDII